MSPCPSPSAMVAPCGLDRLTKKSSSPSGCVSGKTVTLIVLVCSPWANETVPLVDSKSLPDCAVPLSVLKSTVTGVGPGLGAERLMVKVAVGVGLGLGLGLGL